MLKLCGTDETVRLETIVMPESTKNFGLILQEKEKNPYL